MADAFIAAAVRLRLLISRFLGRFGFGDDSFLLLMAILIGIVTGAAAVGFHQLINFIRDLLYKGVGEQLLYSWRGAILLVLFPAAGGLAVGIISRFIFRAREGHGVVDVVESVVRSSGFQKPSTAIEKILTSGITIGSGGSAGAEGPIVQIGAAIASGIGQLFQVARTHMPILVGCGSAAGISAIFNAPFGGVLFTLEIILQDFSIRSFAPVVIASVIAQVTTLAIFQLMHQAEEHRAIFAMPAFEVLRHSVLSWDQVLNFVVLGLICGLLGTALTRMMYYSEHLFSQFKTPRFIRPAIGGAMLGVLGLAYIIFFGHILLHMPNNKPVPYGHYPMPAFYGDGYGVIQIMLDHAFYDTINGKILLLLAFLIAAKLVGTCLTLASGGAGGVIAPSIFLGACAGAIFGTILQRAPWFHDIQPELYALVGMGAVLAAVVHAPLASILICFELTQDYKVMLPAMLACTIAAGMARVAYRDSIYTLTLRQRGINVGASSDVAVLRRINVEQVGIEPAFVVHQNDPLQHLIDLGTNSNAHNFVVVDDAGKYKGMVYSDDVKAALYDREAVPLLVVSEVARTGICPVHSSDDLAAVLDAFSLHDVTHLPVSVGTSNDRVIGLIGRSALMRRYRQALQEHG